MNRQTNESKRKPEYNPNQASKRLKVQKTAMLWDGKINVWSQIYRVLYQNTVLYCTHGDHVWPSGHDIQHNFTILSFCQRLNTEEAKSRFYIPPKISTFPSNQLYLKTFQLLFFIHSLKRSIRQPRVCSVFKLVLLRSRDASEPEIVFVDIQKHWEFPFGQWHEKIFVRLLVEEQNP